MKSSINFVKILLLILIIMFAYICKQEFKVSALKINELKDSEIKYLDTEGLIDHIIDHEINYIYLFSDVNVGIEKFKANNKYYLHLSEKRESITVIKQMLKRDEISIETEKKLELLSDIIQGQKQKNTEVYNTVRTNNDLNIYTPNGSVIQHAEYRENSLTNEDIEEYNDYVLSLYPTLNGDKYMSPANDAYNCHSYAWYEQTSLYNNYWINFPVTYINDMSYIEVDNIRPGDIICYWAYGLNNMKGSLSLSDYISHSAIVVSGNMNLSDNSTLSNLEVISKWGSYGVYKHNGNECPYGTDDGTFKYVKVYRPRTTSMVILNSNIDEISLSKVINANGTIVEHYDMYELNITESTYLDFVISSNNSMSIKLFDEHMQSYYIKLASKDNYEYTYVLLLPIGRYYLRVAYLDNTISGTINTTLKSHNEHLYQYESLNNSYHILKCTCGVTTGNQSRHVIDLSYVDPSGDTRYKPCRYCNCLVDTLVGNHPIIKTVNYKN